MSKPILVGTGNTIDLQAAPIAKHWILLGTPETRARELARSHDRTAYAMVWDCTAGEFDWHYNKDETLVVLEGEAFISIEQGPERRIGPGDVVFFPAGTSARWRVMSYIRKVAVLRHTMPRAVGFGVLAWNFLRRKLGRSDGSGL